MKITLYKCKEANKTFVYESDAKAHKLANPDHKITKITKEVEADNETSVM